MASKQRDFRPFTSVAWRCVAAAAEAGVRGAALCLAYAYGTGQGLLGEEVLGGNKDPAQVGGEGLIRGKDAAGCLSPHRGMDARDAGTRC